ncbi:hypothetical protein SAMN05421748_110187 [Paractinoplanes atraurantiacus]|uniref:Uncharacterized protein n=1 Tax=Paractinoplanes atraurantiacus TaxID=1036182 RepID=A0A285IQM5_9ACTN|nr:hypothetical protein SAMN05421748_110187 [Actinoplanes atraurantiacus]
MSSAGRSSAYCLVLLPLSAAAIAAALAGRPGKAAGWWQVLRERLLGAEGGRIQGPTPAPRRSAVAGHAALSALLGAAALVPLGLEVLTVLRGLLYGLVDHGPYDHSWGGPTLAGAWLAHFAIGIPIIVAAALALTGIAAVHQRLTAALAGRPRAPWVVPVALLAPLPAIAFFIAWLHQI